MKILHGSNLVVISITLQVESFHGAPPAKASGSSRYRQTVSKSSIISSQKQSQPKAKSLHFDHDLDEPMAFVHKSSIAVHKTRLAQNKSEVPLDVAIQTELDHNHLDHMGIIQSFMNFKSLNVCL